jgi:hypothetical protein
LPRLVSCRPGTKSFKHLVPVKLKKYEICVSHIFKDVWTSKQLRTVVAAIEPINKKMMNPALERWSPKEKGRNPKEKGRWSNRDERDLDEVMGYDNQDPVGNNNTSNDQQRPATEVMTIIGMDDDWDMSTIANDTVVSMSMRYTEPPINHPRTPEKKDSSDNDTQPETPPKYSFDSKSYASSKHKNGPSGCFYRTLFAAVFFGLILLGAIGVLGLNLHQLRTSEDGGGVTSSAEEGASSYSSNSGRTIPPFYDFSFLTEAPAAAEANEVPTAATTPRPTMLRAPSPSATATKSPTRSPTMDLKPALREFILAVAPYSSVLDETSIAFQVLEWLIKDPSFKDYTQAQILQRFALGTFFWSFAEKSDITGNWMTYTDECTWGLSRDEDLCDESGNVVSIFLENSNLIGTLAPELSMLSDSLGTCGRAV